MSAPSITPHHASAGYSVMEVRVSVYDAQESGMGIRL